MPLTWYALSWLILWYLKLKKKKKKNHRDTKINSKWIKEAIFVIVVGDGYTIM